jgi:hypothetical protein
MLIYVQATQVPCRPRTHPHRDISHFPAAVSASNRRRQLPSGSHTRLVHQFDIPYDAPPRIDGHNNDPQRFVLFVDQSDRLDVNLKRAIRGQLDLHHQLTAADTGHQQPEVGESNRQFGGESGLAKIFVGPVRVREFSGGDY